VRGYPDDAIGGYSATGEPLGGTALLVINQELRFPIRGMFRGVGFFDAGSPFPGVRDVSLRDLKTSIGAGLRVRTPFVMLRIDYGHPLNGGPDDRGRWFFSIGQMF
jgi:outer membrane protein insertion porin family